jgi:hypothetical protein
MSQYIRQLSATLVMMAWGCLKADVQSAVCGTLKYDITVIPYDKYLGAVFETSSVHFPTCCMLVIALGFSTDLERLPSTEESQHFLIPKISSSVFSQRQFY